MKILTAVVTGGRGDIAKVIIGHLQIAGIIVHAPSHKDLDVTNEQPIAKYLGEKKPDILVNCAGYIKPAIVKDSDTSEWKKHFYVNIIGTYLCTKYALLNGCTKVINIASTSSLEGKKEWSAYCASKAAVVSFTESLAKEGIKAYCISPGRSKTKMRNYLFPDEDQETLLNPAVIGRAILDVLDGRYQPGENIVITKCK